MADNAPHTPPFVCSQGLLCFQLTLSLCLDLPASVVLSPSFSPCQMCPTGRESTLESLHKSFHNPNMYKQNS